MEIVRFENKRPMSLKNMLKYVASDSRVIEKTDGKISFTGGISTDPDEAYLCMMVTKELWHKLGGREYIHFEVSPEVADKKIMAMFGGKIANYFSNYACFFGVHQNTEHIHAHFVLNSVGFDGKKFSQSKSDLKRLKSDVCRIWKEVYSDEKAVLPSGQIISHPSGNKNYGYINTSYVPNISSGYIPSVYRWYSGAYYPVLTYKNQMITAVDEKTDICPMIMIIDDNGNMTPGI